MSAHRFPRVPLSVVLLACLLLLTACGTVGNQTSSTPATPTPGADNPQPQPGTPATPPPTTPPPPQHLYFSYNGSVYGFELHDDGSLARTPGSPYDSGSEVQNSGTPSVSATGEFVFVPNSINCAHGDCIGTNSIATFMRDVTTGTLARTEVTQVGTY